MYEATGNRLAFDVVSVIYNENGTTTDLLTTEHKEIRVAIRGDRVYFPQTLIGGRQFKIRLENTHGEQVTAFVSFLVCQQETPMQYGFLEIGADVG